MLISNILLRSSERSLARCCSRFICRTKSTSAERNLNLEYDLYMCTSSTDVALDPIVVSHGLFGNRKEWVKSCQELNALTARKVISYDAVNHGASDAHSSMTYFDMATDLITILERQKVKNAICLGHRMGGKTAMTLALAQPEKISKLIVIDSAPRARKESMLGDTTQALRDVLSVKLSKFKTKEQVVEKISQINMVPLLRDLVIDNIVKSDNGGFEITCYLNGLIGNYEELISFPAFKEDICYEGPALFLADNEDAQDVTEDVKSITKRFPAAVLHHVDECDFNIHRSIPEDVINVVLEFLNK